jgi:deoxyribodipyrimidine photo-lyase
MSTVHPARVQVLCDHPPKPGQPYALYWMQQSQRARFNHALEYAVDRANALNLPLLVCFGLMDDYPEANARHYLFLLQGLADVAANLERRGIRFVVKRGSPPDVAAHYAKRAALVVADRGYLRHQKAWRAAVAQTCERLGVGMVQVESDAVVPVEVASNKREFAARTLRPKIHKRLAEFLTPLKSGKLKRPANDLKMTGDVDVADPELALKRLKVDHSVPPVAQFFTGGEDAARRRFGQFLARALAGYAEGRNEPADDHTSHMSAYLHFGHVSPLDLALQVRAAGAALKVDVDAYLEELIVRRELAVNYCEFTENYDAYDALPGWAKQTLKDHEADPRPAIYSEAEMERAETGDVFWNAAQREMTCTGFMHNYMRMYWGKRILEWSRTPREAFERTLRLNNRWFLCGRDVNAYANVAWIYGLHDRPWGPARPIFGTVRYMNAAGLQRKFDMAAYVRRVEHLSKSCVEATRG